MKKNSFIQGTVVASISIIITKILGALYVIPFYKIIGVSGGALYSYAYTIYNLFLNISTAGIPIAISMIISEYYTMNKNDAKERAFKIGNKLVFLLSAISFVVIFFFAEYIALFLTSGVTGTNSINDISLVIRAISTCLLIVPFLSVLRGYLQGHKFIAPTSISQVIEQVVRIIVVLLGSFLAIKVFKLKVAVGVAIALFGAFIGALIAYIYLFIKKSKDKTLNTDNLVKDDITNKEIFKKIIMYCIPLILISVIQTLYDTVDLKLIIKGLNMIGMSSNNIEVVSSIVVTWAPKICMVIVAISMGLTTSLIPHMMSSYVKGDMKDVNSKFNQSVSTMLLVTVPMTIVIITFAKEVYYLFYGESIYGSTVLMVSAIVNIFMGVLTVMNTALQGMKKFKIIYINTVAGLLVNSILDIPLIILFNKTIIPPYIATMCATIIGCFVSYLIVFIYLKKTLKFNYRPILHTLKKILIPSLGMILVLVLFKLLVHVKLNYINVLWQLALMGIISCAIYIFITYKNGILEEVLGKSYIDKLLRKLKIKK